MPLTGPAIAHALEHAEALHLRRQVDAYRKIAGEPRATVIEACGGIAALTATVFGRKLNHVTGFGMGAVASASAIAGIEQAYADLGLDTEVDLCPHADPSALRLLGERGYTVNAFSNTYALRLDKPEATPTHDHGITVTDQRSDIERDFVAHSMAGFAVQAVARPPILLKTLAEIAAIRTDTSLFCATVDGTVAGTAGMSLLDTAEGKVAHLYIASTLPAYRARGVQLALLRARLAAARQAGCALATITARPANTSGRNAERAGFQVAYTKATLIKPHRRHDAA